MTGYDDGTTKWPSATADADAATVPATAATSTAAAATATGRCWIPAQSNSGQPDAAIDTGCQFATFCQSQ